jgi:hypothetical protein
MRCTNETDTEIRGLGKMCNDCIEELTVEELGGFYVFATVPGDERKFAVCYSCLKRDEEHVFSQCSVCHKATYCNKECQKNGWKKHKLYCNKTNT